MKSIVFLGLIACAFALDVTTTTTKQPKNFVPILSQENEQDVDGTYHYNFETGDGTKTHQEGQLKHIDAENAGEVVQGSFSYNDKDGNTFSLKYVADENGYQPQGDHLPVAPPIPPQIARALAYLATLPPTTEEPKGIRKN